MTSTETTGTPEQRRRGRRTGCYVFLIAVGVLLAGGLVIVGIAHLQIRQQDPKTRTELPALPGSAAGAVTGDSGEAQQVPATLRRGRLEIDLSVAQLIVVPAEAGEPMRLDAEYDPRFYRLEQEGGESSPGTGEPWTYRIRFAPTGSAAMALIRVKLGARPPTVRLTLPADTVFDLHGELQSSFAALELGGLRLGTVDFEVEGGAAALSFLEPLLEPMDEVSLVGDKGSVKVVGLGNASPREAFFQQHLGELDLDLRGAWVRDAEIDTRAFLAGGTVWLPRNARIEGLEGHLSGLAATLHEEIPLPRLRVTPIERGGRLVFVE